ncbi:hypothetical protein EB796_005717 [Bugula neritina]|uniref:Oxysterol-binding protein n=1 Tax=Bugula neritina TaxID=10212 RepID=A0A7J7KED8_BUGNE|nr:hypothetical protein EB796_005717 [Bugula neritina]
MSILKHKHRRSSVHSAVVAEENRALAEVKEYVNEVCTLETSSTLDQDMLLLKACSKLLPVAWTLFVYIGSAACGYSRQSFKKNHLKSGAKVEWIINNKDKSETDVKLNGDNEMSHLDESSRLVAQSEIGFTQPLPMPAINHEDEVTDSDAAEEKDLGEMEQHKTIILHLLSQLKLGMDLTKVVLPTFILEKRSLLEMFADCMAHPDTFLRIADMTDPRARMTQVVEWYLASFHEGRKGSLAKKPYNPIIGETFHCSWDVGGENGNQASRMLYVAEQVSHHPPVSAFHIACPEKQIHMTGSFWTKSKFMGMSIGVTLIGNLRLFLPEYKEEYVLTLPSAYARSILTYPWVELGDKCSIACKQTGYSASIIFHTKLTLMRELVLDITTGFDSLFNVLAFLRWQIAPGEWRHQVP